MPADISESLGRYNIVEATRILSHSHAQRDPIAHYQHRMVAAEQLLQAVLAVAQGCGYQIGRDRTMPVITHPRHGSVHVWVADDKLCVASRYGDNGGQPENLAIEYDAATQIFVGKEDESYIMPEPGKPKQRRSAVAVVADVIVALLDRESATRSRP